jgi:hypothetical protein
MGNRENTEEPGMRSLGIKRTSVLQVLALASTSLVLPLASQAAHRNAGSPAAPTVSTGGSTHATGSSAVLEGNVDPRNLPTTYYFQYGPSSAYGSQTTPASLPAGNVKLKVSQPVSGIQLGYHYRLVATNAEGTKDGHDRTLALKKTAIKKSGFVLPKAFAPTPLGGTFVLSGTLSGLGNANRAIVLQASAYPYRTALADVGLPITTNAFGGFTFRVSNLFTSTRFRVVTVGAPALASETVAEPVTVRVVLKARASRAGGLVRLYGTVTPAEVGAHVFFQLEKVRAEAEEEEGGKPGKVEKPAKTEKPGRGGKAEHPERPPAFLTKFSAVVRRGTRSVSRFSAVVKVRVAGRYRAFVVIPAGALVSGHSQTIGLNAAPSPAKRKRKG